MITPPGEGGLGAVRIAGPKSHKMVLKIFRPAQADLKEYVPFHLYYGYIIGIKNEIIDEVTMVEMPEGHSYTGQKQVEIFCHGGVFVLRRITEEIFKYGIRPAEPGEFTRRAFLAGRIDLTKAEAVADMVASKTEYAYNAAKKNLMGQFSEYIDNLRNKIIELLVEIEAAIDYPEEEIETAAENKLIEQLQIVIDAIGSLTDSYRSGKMIREGFKIAIAGRTNAGKSSLFNLLLNQNRAIVGPIPGTTRDYLTEWIELKGIAVSLTDTAGLRGMGGQIEKAGQKSAKEIMADSDLTIWIVDITRKNWADEIKKDIKNLGTERIVLLYNKIDKFKKINLKNIWHSSEVLRPLFFSCITRAGLKDLRAELIRQIYQKMPDLTDRLVVTSERHKKKLDCALNCLRKTKRNMQKGVSPELIAFELRLAVDEIDEVTGRVYNEQILDRIFSRFCIGK
ncbi:MAG: tRNA uridine-5-carboxymethylaminomethyl(34) synthesis GTPase MnmE [candidate division Zixibacteria bacterium]|nr:tRNA uridine-5-carboxymethylaminomethyl(34) synthesis GTPase MnmE [candidate division Zixibacteria bacterium]